jgi:hypothetical protein
MNYYKVVSLGRACDIAYQIRRHFGQTEAYPFDWLITPIDGLIKIIRSDFSGFLDRDQLIVKDGQVVHRDTDVIFVHDFEEAEVDKLDELLPAIAEKYARRIDRWRKVIHSHEPILFVRGSQSVGNGILADEDARSIYRALSKTYPRADIHLLAQNTPESHIETKSHGRIHMANVPMPTPFTWSGDDAAWSDVFQRVCRP